jgi:ABC-type sugar transport system permease subunit
MIVPLAMTLWFSVQRYNLLDPTISGFAGIDNYAFLVTDPDFWVSLTNMLLLVGSVLLITAPCSPFSSTSPSPARAWRGSLPSRPSSSCRRSRR